MTPSERIDLIRRATAILVKLKDGEATVAHEDPSETWERGVNTVLDELETLFAEGNVEVLPEFLTPEERRQRKQLIAEMKTIDIMDKNTMIGQIDMGRKMNLGRQLDAIDAKETEAMQRWWRQRRFAMRHGNDGGRQDLERQVLESIRERRLFQNSPTVIDQVQTSDEQSE